MLALVDIIDFRDSRAVVASTLVVMLRWRRAVDLFTEMPQKQVPGMKCE